MSDPALKLVERIEGFNWNPRLPLTDKYFYYNSAADTMVGVVAVILVR